MKEYVAPAALALLCIFALGLAASTASSPDTGDQSNAEAQETIDRDTESVNPDQPQTGQHGTPNASESTDKWDKEETGICVRPLIIIWAKGQLITLVLVTSILAGLVVGKLSSFTFGFATFLLLALLWMPVFLLLTSGCLGYNASLTNALGGGPSEVALNASENATENETGADGQSDDGSQITLPWMLVGVPSFVILFVLVYVWLQNEPEKEVEESSISGDEREVTEQVGKAAGRAADRLEANEGLENDVYEAWADMAQVLDVPQPEKSSPSELAEAATEAGIRVDDVRELTALFEQVRYGTADPTPEREQQAVNALRRIEETYTEQQDSRAESTRGSERSGNNGVDDR